MVMTSRSTKVVVLINTHAGEAEALRNKLYPKDENPGDMELWVCEQQLTGIGGVKWAKTVTRELIVKPDSITPKEPDFDVIAGVWAKNYTVLERLLTHIASYKEVKDPVACALGGRNGW